LKLLQPVIPIPGINRAFQKPGIEENAGLLRRSAALLISGMRIRGALRNILCRQTGLLSLRDPAIGMAGPPVWPKPGIFFNAGRRCAQTLGECFVCVSMGDR
jgi:hypothetical protein